MRRLFSVTVESSIQLRVHIITRIPAAEPLAVAELKLHAACMLQVTITYVRAPCRMNEQKHLEIGDLKGSVLISKKGFHSVADSGSCGAVSISQAPQCDAADDLRLMRCTTCLERASEYTSQALTESSF